MSATQDEDADPGGDDALAAEYVLGVLDAEARRAVLRRIETDAGFATLVDAWEVRLAPLASAYPAVEPPAAVKQAIDARLFREARASARPGLWSSLAFWRGLAAAAVAALAVVVVAPHVVTSEQPADLRLVASLGAQDSDVKYLAMYDAATREVGLSHVSGERSEGKDFELWMIEGDNKPVSMGIIPSGATVHIVLTPQLQRKLAQGAVLAVSVEPAGGSPTGQPTGPVVAAGDLRNI